MKKISIKNMKDVLSRGEMKKISGGSGWGCSTSTCFAALCCTGYICRIHYYPGVGNPSMYFCVPV